MNVIKLPMLRAFWDKHPDAEAALRGWYHTARMAKWRTPADVKATYNTVDPAKFDDGKAASVFNIAQNKYRLIAQIDYGRQVVLVTHVLTHGEYDTNAWKRQGISQTDAGKKRNR